MATLTRKIISGDDLMIFDAKGNSIGYATSHSISLSTDVNSISHKDAGEWSAQEVGKISWEITSENMYSQHDFDALFTVMSNKQAVKVWFGLKSGYRGSSNYNASASVNDETVGDGNWAPATGQNLYYGQAFLTSLEVSASTGEKATFSVTFTGTGPISKGNFTAATSGDMGLEI